MLGEQNLTPDHLSRRAVIYLRQSSEGQVRNNVESQQLQYALAEKARALGFQQVEIIDSDLGSSAAVAAKRREGFQRLLGAVAIGEVGLVLSRELSRLLRTDKDFCQLVELCQIFGTLVGDEQTLYDVNRMDDQLVLGIKATLSVVELKVLRMRLLEGKENKARRGELYPRLPVGYEWDSIHRITKDPNVRVQEAIELVFAKFHQIGSVRQTFKWFRDNDVALPVRKVTGAKLSVVFQVPRLSFVGDVLHNPFYAGAYVWGRRSTQAVYRAGVLTKRTTAPVSPEEARAFIREHHQGYIDWMTFEENQRIMRSNYLREESDHAVGAVRAGKGLLAGLLRCGHCGRRFQVRYWGKSGTAARYLCTGDFVTGGNRYCLGFGGATVDRRLSEELVRVISPLGVEASLAALEHLGHHQDDRRQALKRELQQLEYEVARAAEQYHQVDPKNRLVAGELESRWNEKLEAATRVRESLAELGQRSASASPAERAHLVALGNDFAAAWSHPACPIELKKQITRLLIKEVVVTERPQGTLTFVVHWNGGDHTCFSMDKPNPRTLQRTAEDDLDVIRKMAVRYGDGDIARVLNKLGRTTGKGKPWSEQGVKSARSRYGIAGRSQTLTDPDLLTLQGAARATDTSDTTIRKLVEAGILPMHQVVPFAPWEIRRADLELPPVRAALEHLKKTGRLALARESSGGQQDFFQ